MQAYELEQPARQRLCDIGFTRHSRNVAAKDIALVVVEAEPATQGCAAHTGWPPNDRRRWIVEQLIMQWMVIEQTVVLAKQARLVLGFRCFEERKSTQSR